MYRFHERSYVSDMRTHEEIWYKTITFQTAYDDFHMSV